MRQIFDLLNAAARRVAAIFGLSLVIMLTVANAAGAPTRLRGKSVVVGWLVDRDQTYEGEAHSTHQSINFDLKLYISSAGRSFSKLSQVAQYKGRTTFGNSELGPGEGAATDALNRVPHFDGSSLFVDTKIESGARRIIVGFDTGYTTCNARVIYGKEGGSQTLRQTGALSGRRMIVHSVKVSAVTCSVHEGNIFGG